MKHYHSAFTLVEVAVAGSLIGLCVLTAVSIIPQGMRVQDEARMRAVAAAAVMSLSAQGQTGGPTYSAFSQMTASTTPSGLYGTIKGWDSNGTISTPPASVYQAATLPPAGDLARRLVFSIDGSGPRAITVWMLSRDPINPADKRARYLTTFVEAN